MPIVGNKKFPYTKEGIQMAKKANFRTRFPDGPRKGERVVEPMKKPMPAPRREMPTRKIPGKPLPTSVPPIRKKRRIRSDTGTMYA